MLPTDVELVLSPGWPGPVLLETVDDVSPDVEELSEVDGHAIAVLSLLMFPLSASVADVSETFEVFPVLELGVAWDEETVCEVVVVPPYPGLLSAAVYLGPRVSWELPPLLAGVDEEEEEEDEE